MHPDPEDVGPVRIGYEVHSFRDQTWFRLSAFALKNEAVASAEKLFGDGTVAGVRVVRTELYEAFGFSESILVHKRLSADAVETDPLANAVDIAAGPFWWRQLGDLYSDMGRDELRSHLGRYLEDKRITTLELVHHERHAMDLDNAGTVLQGAIQKVAITQAQIGKLTASTLFKDMMGVFTQLVQQLRTDADKAKVSPLVPGEVAGQIDQMAEQYGPDAGRYHFLRHIAALVFDAKTWMEKLDRLGQIYDPSWEMRHLRLLDAALADIFSAAGPYRELLEEGSDRVSALCAVTSLLGGSFRLANRSMPRGLPVLLKLVADNRTPRTRSVLRRRLLREFHSRQPLISSRALLAEMEGLNTLIRFMGDNAPGLVRDEEVVDAVTTRAGRAITLEAVAEAINPHQKVTDKLALISRLAAITPGALNKATLYRHFRAVLPPDDMVRLCVRDTGNRLSAVNALGEVQQMILGAPLDEMTRADTLGAIDVALLDIFKNDILQAQGKSYADRIALLIKVCSESRVTEGKARALAVETIGRDIRNPKFMPTYLQRFRTEAERKDALLKLKSFLQGANGQPNS